MLRRALRPTSSAHHDLVVCHRCSADFVVPVSWHELGETDWWIRLRCGECGFVREDAVSNEAAERFDAELDRGMAKIASRLAGLNRARTIAETDALTAFARDLIDPGDFRL
jgi:uncharacterized Zn finger protein